MTGRASLSALLNEPGDTPAAKSSSGGWVTLRGLELVNTVPFKDSSHYESLNKLNQIVRVI